MPVSRSIIDEMNSLPLKGGMTWEPWWVGPQLYPMEPSRTAQTTLVLATKPRQIFILLSLQTIEHNLSSVFN